MDKLFRPIFNELPETEKRTLLQAIANTHPEFSLIGFEKFERFGQSTETAVYQFENQEFVFVPGDTVTLGWESFAEGMDDRTRQDMMEALQEYGIDDLDAFLKESMSPVRTVRIAPMLVERQIHDIGWHHVALDSQSIVENQEFQAAVTEFRASRYRQYTLNEALRLTKDGAAITAELYSPVSYDEWVRQIEASGFRLPTEDEWEYLCGGGLRTLFRWGDSFDYDLHLKHFEKVTPEKTEYDLQQPNQFGICIAYDPYKYEVVMESEHFLKGGDGGCGICGGSGLALGYLPVATYYRDRMLIEEDDPLDYKSDIGGDYTFYRRIVRLG